MNRKNNRNQLCYDSLEPRLALTAFIVNSTIDDATGTVDGLIGLREAVIAANTNMAFGDAPAGEAAGDTIQFTIAGETITLTEGEISITDDLAIQGESTNNTIDGNGDRIFFIDTAETVGMGRMTLIDGRATQGGAIYSTNFGARNFVGMTFSNNVSTGVGGGAIYHENGNIAVIDSEFVNNRAATSTSARGGAIYLQSGRLTVNNGEMVSNSASLTGGAIEVNGGDVYMNNAQIGRVGEGNTAGSGNTNGRGGGLHVNSTTSNIYVNGGEFNSNTASREGGGLWNQAGALMSIKFNARILNNVASGNFADDGGGGIFNNGGSLVVNSSTISSNVADGTLGSGGGIQSTSADVLVINSTLAANQANRAGGGMEIIDGEVFVVNSTLGGSSAVLGNIAGPSGSANPGNGGGLHISGTATSVYVLNTRVENNVAATEGGGLWNEDNSLLRIDNNSMILSNRANGTATDDGGGGIFNNGGRLTIGNSTISGNQAGGTFGSGGGILSTDGTVLVFSSLLNGNAAARAGGGIEIIDGFMNLSNVTINGNTAGVAYPATPGDGGGVHVSGFNLTRVVIDGGFITNNSAGNNGGGLWNEAQSTMFLRGNVQITGNFTTGGAGTGRSGGGLYNRGHVEATDAFFGSNTADLGGGFFNAPSGTSGANNFDFNNNTAFTFGGGIYNSNFINLQNSTVSNNDAGSDGGGIFNTQVGQTLLTNVNFFGNVPNDTN